MCPARSTEEIAAAAAAATTAAQVKAAVKERREEKGTLQTNLLSFKIWKLKRYSYIPKVHVIFFITACIIPAVGLFLLTCALL